MLTPKGLSVSSLALRIWSLSRSGGIEPPAISPSPPPFDTAAASEASATQAIPPWIKGYFVLSKLHILLLFILPPLVAKYSCTICQSGTKTANRDQVAALKLVFTDDLFKTDRDAC